MPEGEEEEAPEAPETPQVQVETDEPEFEGRPPPQLQRVVDAPNTVQVIRDLVGQFLRENAVDTNTGGGEAALPPPDTVPDDAGAQLQVAIGTTPAPPPVETPPPAGADEPVELLGGNAPEPGQEPIFAEPGGTPPPDAAAPAPEVETLGGGAAAPPPGVPETEQPVPAPDAAARGVVVDVVA
ncbi:MAG: hypothetical protein V3V62_06445 [bacterium]